MKKVRILPIVGCLVCVVLILWLFLRVPLPNKKHDSIDMLPRPSQQASLPKEKVEPTNNVIKKIQSVFLTPIIFYGRVVDQNEVPVAKATIRYNVTDRIDGSGSNYENQSDRNGFFSISGISGAVLLVGVSKEGYYKVDGKSADAFAYGVGADSTRRLPPVKANPAIFILHKSGSTEPLNYVSSRQIDTGKSGHPITISLTSGDVLQNGDLQVSSWVGDSKRRSFDWRYELRILGGGLIERKGKFDFEAPVDGYQTVIEVSMLATAERWSSRLSKDYFAKLNDGRYARFSIQFYPGSRNFIVLESYVNPSVGSRNVEFDPKKAIEAR